MIVDTMDQLNEVPKRSINPDTVHHLVGIVTESLPGRDLGWTLASLPRQMGVTEIQAVAGIAQQHDVERSRNAERRTIATLGRLSSEEKRGDYVTARNAADYLRSNIGGVVAHFQAWRIDRQISRNNTQPQTS